MDYRLFTLMQEVYILPKLDDLCLLCADSKPHVVCIVETWLEDSVFDNELTVSNYFLLRLDRTRHGGGVLLYIGDDLSYNVIFMGPKNLELLGITSYNGNNNRFCLFTLNSPPATTHLVLQQLFIFLQPFFILEFFYLLVTLMLIY